MRSRNIKPGFFKNADLLDLPFETRILFAGLWTIADKEGRLRDRVKQIKIEIFPVDNVDIDTMLDQLVQKKFITRYEVQNERYIQIHNWLEHQHPHPKEATSDIPQVPVIEKNTRTGNSRKSRAKPRPVPERPGNSVANPSDSLSLIPDSLSLIPDSCITPSATLPELPVVEKVPITHQPIKTFEQFYKQRTGKDYVTNWGKDGKISKDLIGRLAAISGGEEGAAAYICSQIEGYFTWAGAKWWDFSAFASNFNKFQAEVHARDGPKINMDRYRRAMISGGAHDKT